MGRRCFTSVEMVARSRYGVLLATVLLVLLAGCSGLLGGGAGGDGAGNAGTVSEFDYPDGWSKDGVTRLDAAVATHYAAGTRGSSYTERLVFRISQDGTVQRNNSIRYAVDRESREMLARIDGAQGSQVAYYGNGTLTNYDPKNESVISRGNASFSKLANASRLTVAEALHGIDLDASTVVERGRTTAVKYSVTGTTSNSSYTEASGTVVVAEDGRILSLDVTKRSERQTVTYRYVLEAVGNTDVERPSWVER